MSTKFDAAISFVAQDEPLALSLRDQLQPPLSVFVFSKAQEQLAGRDGIEAFRTVFLERSELVVILYRAPWGETPWTRVEKEAIEEFALINGWERLIFVRLDQSPVPKWVPRPHLYLDAARYSLGDLVGAIKTRLIELDVEIKPVSSVDRAGAVRRKRDFDQQTQLLLGNSNLEFNGAHQMLLDAIVRDAKLVQEKAAWPIACGIGALIGGFVVSAQGQGLQLMVQDIYINSAASAYISVREYSTNLVVQQPGMNYWAINPMDIVGERRMEIRRLPDVGWCWELDGRVLPVDAAADAILQILLDRIERNA